jgi:ribosomal protein L19
MNLYKINNEFQNAINTIVEICDDGFVDTITGEVISQNDYDNIINTLSINREDKIKNCLYYIKQLEADNLTVSNEIARLQNIKKSKSNHLDSFKKYVLNNLNVGEKLDFNTIKVSCGKGISSIVINDAGLVQSQYCTTTITPSKTLIKKALLAGDEVDGATLITKDKRLLIK